MRGFVFPRAGWDRKPKANQATHVTHRDGGGGRGVLQGRTAMKTLAWAFGLAMLFAPAAMAQTNDELVKGATDTNNVLNHGMGYNLQRFCPLKQINKDTVEASRPGLELQLRRQSQRGIPAAGLQGRALRHHQQRHDGDRRQDRQANLENQGRVSAGDAAHRLLRHHQSRRRIYDGKIFRTTLDANVIALDAQDRQGAVAQERDRFQDGLLDDRWRRWSPTAW